MKSPRLLVLVSQRADARLRSDVQLGNRPCPEYLRLEETHCFSLLDWSQLGPEASGRSARLSFRHARAALDRLDDYDGVLSDGEHVGLPLALAMLPRRKWPPHVMLCHHLTSRPKPLIFRRLQPQRRMSRLLLHSLHQLKMAARRLKVPASLLHFLPYGVDDRFWAPRPTSEERLVVSAGREHRDFRTLYQAMEGLRASAFVASGSLHSPGARREEPARLPENVSTGFADHRTLRDWYSRAAVVVVPLVPNDFQAGVTTLLEAMAMGKPVVVTATEGQRDVVEHGVTGLTVPAGDPAALRESIGSLLDDAGERRRLGANARSAVESRHSLDGYAASLARHLEEALNTPLRIQDRAWSANDP